ncbi:Maltose O-acetyltransferase [Campylobacter hyointestinalis]|nr:Maltose O-acetyltransferase [Campylobacter hyointestinalis]
MKMLQFLINEYRATYKVDILRFRTKFFIFLFNIIPDLYCIRVFKNLFLKWGGVNLNSLTCCYIKSKFYIDTAKVLYIGNGVFMNKNVSLEGEGTVMIGDGVKIGPNVQFITTNHLNGNDEVKDIYIGNNVWIGANCIILPGSIIEENINIAAGSIVRGKILDGKLWAGNPAIKKR